MKGSHYTDEARKEILEKVDRLRVNGGPDGGRLSVDGACKLAGIACGTYHAWKNGGWSNRYPSKKVVKTTAVAPATLSTPPPPTPAKASRTKHQVKHIDLNGVHIPEIDPDITVLVFRGKAKSIGKALNNIYGGM